MKPTVSKICGLSNTEINKYIDINVFEVVRLNMTGQACSAQSIFYKLFDKPIFENTNNMKEALDALEWCKDIPNVVFGNPKLRNVNSLTEKQNAMDFFNEYTQRYNNIISIEPLHSSYGTNFITSYKEAIEFIDKLNNPRVRINLDIGSCSIAQENISNIDFINHVHISGQHLQKIDEKNLNYYKKVVSFLRESCYNKYVSLETLNFEDDINIFIDIMEGN